MRHLVFDKWMWGVLSELCQLSSSSLHMIIYIHFEVFLYCLNINCIHFLARCLCGLCIGPQRILSSRIFPFRILKCPVGFVRSEG